MSVENWHDEARKLRGMGNTYEEIADKLGQTYHAVRGFLRRKPGEEAPETLRKKHTPALTTENLLEDVTKGISLPSIMDKYAVDEEAARLAITDLHIKGFQVETLPSSGGQGDTLFVLRKIAVPKTEPVTLKEWQGNSIIRFGQVTDTHLCSIFQQISFLRYAYNVFAREGITTVYHAGDVSDGEHMRRGHEYELFVHGADNQCDYVAENYPYNPSIQTVAISGNHDLSFMAQSGLDLVKMIANKREDIHYLGPELAHINLTPRCILELWHGRDGSAYADSYALQKYLDAMPGGDKPNILFAGHRHKSIYLPYRNVHAFEGGCMQAQTPFMRGKKLRAAVGFWIAEAEVDPQGTVVRMKSEFIPLYTPLKKDF